MRVVQQALRKLRLACGLAIVKLTDDARAVQQVQLTLLDGEVRSKVNHYQPYGFTSYADDGAEAVAVAVGGNRNHLVALVVDDGRWRKKNLAKGEVSLYHKSGSYVHLLANGDVKVFSASKLEVQAPSVTMSGSLDVQGPITSQAQIQGNTVRTAAGIQLGTHQHGGVQGGTGNTGAPQ